MCYSAKNRKNRRRAFRNGKDEAFYVFILGVLCSLGIVFSAWIALVFVAAF